MKTKSAIIAGALTLMLAVPIQNTFALSGTQYETTSTYTQNINTDAAKSRQLFLELNKVRIGIGDSKTQVINKLGLPSRIDSSGFDFDWYVYNSDYSRFVMVGIKDGVVKGLYTNTKGFTSNVASYGNLKTASTNPHVKVYRDSNDSNKISALLITESLVKPQILYTEEFYKSQELQVFDITNAFRVNHGLAPLKPNSVATLTAKTHSRDMATKNYFSHVSLNGDSPLRRYLKLGGFVSSSGYQSGENIAAGNRLGIDAFNAWMNSKGHRDNMLGNYVTMGVGFSENSAASYKYYMTEFFI